MTGLREQKKQATREALREAALRLALESGPDQVRVDDIAEAAGVSPRTYNNYFSSREQAIVAGVTAEREERVAAAVAARSSNVRLVDAVIDGIVEQFTDPPEPVRGALLMITTSPALREAFATSASAMEHPLADAIAKRIGGNKGEGERGSESGSQKKSENESRSGSGKGGGSEGGGHGGGDQLTARVLAASVVAAVRVALTQWVQPTGSGLVVPRGSLPDLMRRALAPLAPALDAADRGSGRHPREG